MPRGEVFIKPMNMSQDAYDSRNHQLTRQLGRTQHRNMSPPSLLSNQGG